MPFQQLIESALASGLDSAQWFEYASRLIEKRLAANDDLAILHEQLWDALLQTTEKYQGLSAVPLGYLRTVLQSPQIPVLSLMSCMLYSSTVYKAKTIDSVAFYVLEHKDAKSAIHNGIASRPARIDSQKNNGDDHLALLRRCVTLGQGDHGARLVVDVIESLQKVTVGDSMRLQRAAHTVLSEISGQASGISDVVLQSLRAIAGEQGTAQEPEDVQMAIGGESSSDFRSDTPDPLASAPTNGSSTGRAYTHIKTPIYITCALQNALEQTWTWQSSRRPETIPSKRVDDQGPDLTNVPIAYRDLIHLGPILTTNPSTFAHFLLQASFEAVFSSLQDLRQGAKPDLQSSVKPEDQIMADLSTGTEPSERDRIAARIVKVGWNEITWLFHGLAASLGYWQWSSAEGREDADWHQDWRYPSTVAQSLNLINDRYRVQLDELDSFLIGNRTGGSREASTIDIVCSTMQKWSLITGPELRHHGLGKIDQTLITTSNDRDVDEIMERYMMLTGPPDSRLVYDTLTQPSIWDGLASTICRFLETFWDSASPVVTALSENFVLLQLVCLHATPSATLNHINDAMSSDQINLAIQSDPQTTITNYGALVFLASTICFKYNISLPISLKSASRVYLVNELSSEEDLWLKGWIQAIFGTTGISDDLLQSTQPQMLLRLATTLVSQAISAAISQVIDIETLHSGLSYFSQPLLSWCQAGIIDWLCAEIQRQGVFAAIYLDVLQLLLGSEELPESTVEANCQRSLSLFEKGNGLELVLESSDIDTTKLIGKLRLAQTSISDPVMKSSEDWETLLRVQLRQSSLDSARCVRQAIHSIGLAPTLMAAWEELCLVPSGEKTFIALYLGHSQEPHVFQHIHRKVGSDPALSHFRLRVCKLLAKFAASPKRLSTKLLAVAESITQKVAAASKEEDRALLANCKRVRAP